MFHRETSDFREKRDPTRRSAAMSLVIFVVSRPREGNRALSTSGTLSRLCSASAPMLDQQNALALNSDEAVDTCVYVLARERRNSFNAGAHLCTIAARYC